MTKITGRLTINGKDWTKFNINLDAKGYEISGQFNTTLPCEVVSKRSLDGSIKMTASKVSTVIQIDGMKDLVGWKHNLPNNETVQVGITYATTSHNEDGSEVYHANVVIKFARLESDVVKSDGLLHRANWEAARKHASDKAKSAQALSYLQSNLSSEKFEAYKKQTGQ